MKKPISLLLSVIIIVLAFSSCSSKPNAELTEENITKTVDTAFTALKEFDTKKLDTYVSSSTLSIIMKYAESHTQFQDLGKAIFANLSYEIKSIDTQNSTVTVSVLNKDLYDKAYNFVNGLLQNYSTLQLLQRLGDDAWLDNNLTKLTDEIDSASMQSSPTDITLTISQSSKNLVLQFDENAENGVSGGALSAIKGAIS
ncbi:MAG: hypothetical protein LUG21_01765 [Clostridiales bacterium]|nr:hypothetical protein [Clostridiales bacterium]